MKKLEWCFKAKNGIKIREPSEEISRSYLNLSKSTLKGAETIIKQNLLWASVMIYYAEYYALYSFLARIGIKSENHLCSILLTEFLLGENKMKFIEKHRKIRIDAQYYLRIEKEDEIENMLKKAKFFIADVEMIISNLEEKDIKKFRKKLNSFYQ